MSTPQDDYNFSFSVDETVRIMAALETIMPIGGGSPEHTIYQRFLKTLPEEHQGHISTYTMRYTANVLRGVAEQFEED